MDYWTHNTAYYPWVVRQLTGAGKVLDVGCGDGLLVQMLSDHCDFALAIEPDLPSAQAARERLTQAQNVRVEAVSFKDLSPAEGPFDDIVFVASLHHMNQEAALLKAKDLLVVGGKLIVVGCAYPDTPWDWLLEVLRVIPARVGSLVHGEKTGGKTIAPTMRPPLPLSAIRSMVRANLPHAKMRQGLYYRYLLVWEKQS